MKVIIAIIALFFLSKIALNKMLMRVINVTTSDSHFKKGKNIKINLIIYCCNFLKYFYKYTLIENCETLNTSTNIKKTTICLNFFILRIERVVK